MIASIVPMALKAKLSDEITLKTEAFLSAGGAVSEIPIGVGHNTNDTYREFQSKVAKINAAERVAREAGLQ